MNIQGTFHQTRLLLLELLARNLCHRYCDSVMLLMFLEWTMAGTVRDVRLGNVLLVPKLS